MKCHIVLSPPLIATKGFLFVLQNELVNQMQKNMTKGIKKKSEDMGSRPMFEWYMWINNMHDLVNILTDYGLYPMGKCFILSLTIFVYSYTSTLLNISHTICK